MAEEKLETDEQIINRLRDKFKILTQMTLAIKHGDVRSMIVSGPPGVGKSYEIEAVLEKEEVFNTIANKKPNYEVVKGAMSAIGLYKKLYEYKDAGNVLVFDDCDCVLFDDLSLNILKAALDTSKRRKVCWNTDSYSLRREGLDNQFDFNAGAIFITNVDFANVKSKKLKPHMEALESRCHYIDLTLNSEREKILRIKQIVNDGMLKHYSFTSEEEKDVVAFIEENKNILHELTLRMVLKISDLRKSFPEDWKHIALTTCNLNQRKKRKLPLT